MAPSSSCSCARRRTATRRPTRAIGFGPTRKAVSRIAKEGRKYGVFLGLVTQRPAELDATIISQCSTLFAMRMANDRDQAVIRAAVSDAAASLLAFVPSLGTREAFAFGEGVALPTRLRFSQLPAEFIPKSESVSSGECIDAADGIDTAFIEKVVERWRGATMGNKRKAAESALDDPERRARCARNREVAAARGGPQPAPRALLRAGSARQIGAEVDRAAARSAGTRPGPDLRHLTRTSAAPWRPG